MSTLNCKMCAAPLKYVEGKQIIECEFCGNFNTLPNFGDEKRLRLFDRANKLRSNSEFDKASGVYEVIVSEYPDEAEAYWGLVLCKYGVEYVDDPVTGKKVPTCHKSSYDCVLKDPVFELVMEKSFGEALDIYRSEAKRIEEIRKGIVEISLQEAPYDVFICYKETDENGSRTLESVIAQDVYDALISNGYRVFFSRITLEDKLGQQYEPYIFSALNSSKVMLVFGFSYQNYNAVWVKNEWTRFLSLMEKDKTKYLIPCYKDIDAYDIPEEFSRFQAQDMGKLGAVQDLVRGVVKLLRNNNATFAATSERPMNSFISEKTLIDNNRLDSDGDYARVKMYAGEEFRAYLEKTERTILSGPGYSILVGSEVYFGRQPDGQKPITWVVLEKNKDSILLMSSDVVAEAPFSSGVITPKWKKNPIRKLLNEDFYMTAFNDNERAFINDIKLDYFTSDKVRLMSIKQFDKYLYRNETLRKHTKVQCGAWWLMDEASYVNEKGTVSQFGSLKTIRGVRPVIEVDIKAFG